MYHAIDCKPDNVYVHPEIRPRVAKFRILHDYGAYEGMKFYEGEFTSVDDAVKAASVCGCGVAWMIVQIVQWEAREL